MAKGVIYITTTSVEGLIKIGRTETNQFENRMRFLEQNGYWNVSGLRRYYAVEVENYTEKEKLIHTIFGKSQVATSELFALNKDLAKELLDSFGGRQIFPKIDDVDKLDEAANKTPKAPRLTFQMLDIPIGSTLVFKNNVSITCKTIDNDNKVEYDGDVYAISILAAKLLGYKSAQGGAFFTYKGKTLVQIRKEKEKNNDRCR